MGKRGLAYCQLSGNNAEYVYVDLIGEKNQVILDNVAISIHEIKVAGISPFNHLKCINGCFILIALRISSATLLYKLQNSTEKVVFRTNASSQKS